MSDHSDPAPQQPVSDAAAACARDFTAIGYGLFALQQTDPLDQIAVNTGTAEVTGRHIARRSTRDTDTITVDENTGGRLTAAVDTPADSTTQQPAPARRAPGPTQHL